MPDILKEEYADDEFNITFHGTMLDYEDLIGVCDEAKKSEVVISCKHIQAKEVSDKENDIAELFEEIQKGPFDELKTENIKHAFKQAKSSDFEVNVIAAMSSGKSTLINALLRRKLMPAKNEACTATITRIKDNDNDLFRADAYDKNNNKVESHENLTLDIMTHLNSDNNISEIKVEENIPFVTSEEVSLILVDTPGPNNSRDSEHKETTYKIVENSSKTLVLYVLNAANLGVSDDKNLLIDVANSMSTGGKQSKDRFIFVVNKLDEYAINEQDDVALTIENVKEYLKTKKIENPNIYPAAALPALDIRTYLKNSNIDNATKRRVENKVLDLNELEKLHLEKYSTLTPSIRNKIANDLKEAKEKDDTYAEALIHTGIIPLEHAIRMYVKKICKNG